MDEFDTTSMPSLRRDVALRGIRHLILIVAVIVSALPGRARAGEDDRLPEEVEQAFQVFIDEAAEARLEKLQKTVEKYATGLADGLELDEAARDSLAERYPEIVAATQSAWREKFQELYRPSLTNSANSTNPIEILKSWDAKAFANNQNYPLARPDRTPAWRDVLSAVLSPEQLAHYDAEEKAKAEELRRELEDHLLRCEEIATTRMQPIMDAEISQLQALAKLDEQRLEKLNAAATSAIEATVNDWCKRWEDQVMEMDDAQRMQRTGSNAFPPLDTSKAENPMSHQIWKDALAQVLSEAELTEVKQGRAARRRARSEALAMLMVDELEPLVGFSAEQRKQLKDRFATSMLTLPEAYYAAQANNSYFSLNPGQLFNHISGIAESEVLPLLDEGQAERWKGVTQQALASNIHSSRGKVDGLEIPPPDQLDSIEAQRLITTYIYLRAKDYTRNYRARMEALVAGIARIAQLEPEQVAVLSTAAKGAAQALAKDDIRNFESWARQNLQNVLPADLPERLKNHNLPNFSNQRSTAEPPILTSTGRPRPVARTEETLGCRARGKAAVGRDCRLAILMTEIEKIVILEQGKRDKLASLVGKALDEYQQELDNMFSFKWHIQGYYSMVAALAHL